MRGEEGVALLEVIVGLTVLVLIGFTASVMVVEATEAVHRAARADAEMRAASAFLDAVALWPREDLDRRLGDRRQGPWRLRLDRPTPTLYTAVLSDSTGRSEILRTSLYRPRIR